MAVSDDGGRGAGQPGPVGVAGVAGTLPSGHGYHVPSPGSRSQVGPSAASRSSPWAVYRTKIEVSRRSTVTDRSTPSGDHASPPGDGVSVPVVAGGREVATLRATSVGAGATEVPGVAAPTTTVVSSATSWAS